MEIVKRQVCRDCMRRHYCMRRHFFGYLGNQLVVCICRVSRSSFSVRALVTEQFRQRIQIRHDADASLGAEAADLGRREVPNISRAEYIRGALRRRVQHRVVIRSERARGRAMTLPGEKRSQGFQRSAPPLPK